MRSLPKNLLLTAAVLFGLCFVMLAPAAGADASRITTDELQSRLGETDLVVLDVRGSWDWVKSSQKITGAVRVDPGGVKEWAGQYPVDKTIILYCA